MEDSPITKKWRSISLLESVLLLLLCASCISCSGLGRSSPLETILEEAFDCLKRNDWKAYSRLTITPADFMIRHSQLSAFKARHSYAGGVLRPQQTKQQEQQFRRATEGGPGFIDFRNARFVGVGSLLDSGTKPLLPDGAYNYEVYSIRVEMQGSVVDTEKLRPRFMLVKWGNQLRIVRLLVDEH